MDCGSTERAATPDLPAYRLMDLADAMGITEYKIIGLPDYEKKAETMDGIVYSDEVRRLTIKELKEVLKNV
jgi:hypothetical protein